MEGFPRGPDIKESACNVGDLGVIPGLGRSPEEDMAAQASILAWRIPIDRGTWRATVHRVAQSRTRLSNLARTQGEREKQEKGQWV